MSKAPEFGRPGNDHGRKSHGAPSGGPRRLLVGFRSSSHSRCFHRAVTGLTRPSSIRKSCNGQSRSFSGPNSATGIVGLEPRPGSSGHLLRGRLLGIPGPPEVLPARTAGPGELFSGSGSETASEEPDTRKVRFVVASSQ